MPENGDNHEFGEPVFHEERPDPFWADKDPDQYVGREYVGDCQRTWTADQGGNRFQYRVGITETGGLVVDRLALDRYHQSPEPTRIDLADAPEGVQEEARDLLAEHMPDIVKPADEEPSPGYAD